MAANGRTELGELDIEIGESSEQKDQMSPSSHQAQLQSQFPSPSPSNLYSSSGKYAPQSMEAAAPTPNIGETSLQPSQLSQVSLHKTEEDKHHNEAEPGSDFKPERKQRNFEFTSNLCVFRVIRTILYIQIIQLILDNPSAQVPVIYQVFCRYVIRIYVVPLQC